MNAKATSIVAYIGLVGWLVAYFFGDKEGARFHMNQALVMGVFGGACMAIPFLGWACCCFVGVCEIIGLIYAATGQDKEVLFFNNWVFFG